MEDIIIHYENKVKRIPQSAVRAFTCGVSSARVNTFGGAIPFDRIARGRNHLSALLFL